MKEQAGGVCWLEHELADGTPAICLQQVPVVLQPAQTGCHACKPSCGTSLSGAVGNRMSALLRQRLCQQL